jgi:hypothetical protein
MDLFGYYRSTYNTNVYAAELVPRECVDTPNDGVVEAAAHETEFTLQTSVREE